MKGVGESVSSDGHRLRNDTQSESFSEQDPSNLEGSEQDPSNLEGSEQDPSNLEGYPGDLMRYWHPIARSEEVHDQPRQFTLLGEKVVVFRDAQGVVAFKDLCIHRGTRLSLGRITPAGQLQCAYHGWEYDRTGACTRIPARPEGSTIPGKAKAIAYSAKEAYGLVWVAMKDPIHPIPEFPNNEFHDPAWRTFLALEHTWKTSAGRILENYCDWSHIPFVHNGVLGTPDRPRPTVEPAEIWEEENRLGYSYEQVDLSFLGGGELSIRREFVVYLPFFPHLYKIRPNGETIIISSALAPREPKLTTIYLWISRNHDFDTDDDFYRDYITEPMEQDRVVVESQRPEEVPDDLRDELHIKVPDAFSIEYRRVLKRIMEASSFGP